MNPIRITKRGVGLTLEYLQDAGRRNSECVVLWLGRRLTDSIEVEQVWLPPHRAGRLYFEFNEAAMTAMMAKLRKERQMIVAQVHSHPEEAFHSSADDDWAVIRHEGALSLVVPYFAGRTNVETFARDLAAFVLNSSNCWAEIEPANLDQYLRIQ